MKQSIFTIVDNMPLTDNVYRMVLEGDTSSITAPGQFVNLKLDGLYLRRPISVCNVQGDQLITHFLSPFRSCCRVSYHTLL